MLYMLALSTVSERQYFLQKQDKILIKIKAVMA